MRPGHQCSGRFEQGFEPGTEFQALLKAVPYSELVDKDRPKAKRWVAMRPKVGHLSMSIKDAEDQFMHIFNRERPQLMEDAPDVNPIVGVRVASLLRGHQQSVGLRTILMQVRRLVGAPIEAGG
jgi:hypothetical protein